MTPEQAYYQARNSGKRCPELEPIIQKNAVWAHHYAHDVIQGRWPEAEEIIAKNAQFAYYYAVNVIGGRWPEAEATIKQDAYFAYQYALSVIKGRWPEAEATIQQDARWAYLYAANVIKGPWPEAEATIQQDEAYAYLYAANVIKGPGTNFQRNSTVASTPVTVSTLGHEYTELKPQLLNPITTDEMEAYITDDKWLAQEKLDGKRIMVEVNFGKVIASNRRSWKVGIPQDIEEELEKFEDCILDGELVGGVYCVFDCLSHNGQDIREWSCAQRFNTLIESVIGDRMLYQVEIVPTAFSTDDKRALVASLQHKEGVVLKELNAPYSVGRPNKGGSQLKCKFWSSATCVVTKINTATNKVAKRSVAVSVASPNGFVPVGNVTVPLNYELPKLGDYIEVKYLYAYKGGSLYQPQYLGIRDDVEIDLYSSLKFKAEV